MWKLFPIAVPKTLLNSTMNNDLCISQTYSNDNVKTSKLHDTHIVMNKGEIKNPEYNCVIRDSSDEYQTSKKYEIAAKINF
jgi:glucose-6-phosphate dehydrogenase assembly protein OpcA